MISFPLFTKNTGCQVFSALASYVNIGCCTQ